MDRRVRLIVLPLLLAVLTACGGQQAIAPTIATDTSAAPTIAAAPTTSAAPTTAATAAATMAATMAATTQATTAATMAATSAAMPVATAATTASGGTELNVFAAASLTDAFKEVGKNFETANPGATLIFNFAGSQQLAQQIGQGAPADVFASANAAQMNVVIKSGQVISGTQRTFVRNRLVAIYPKDNPAQITSLKDLAKPGIKLVLADKSVPVGGYALTFLGKASKLPEYGETYSQTVLANVVSYEQDVKAVLSKVALGEADAGIVYTTDITADAADKVTKLEIPDTLNTIASYPIAAIKDSKNADLAQKFVTYVLSPDAQTVLVKYGFISTTGNASGGAAVAGPLAISGLVDTPLTLTTDDLKKRAQVSIKATDKGGTEQSYSGVSIAALLKDAGVQAAAKSVVFTGGDGYSKELALSDLMADTNAIISVADDGSVRDILPSQMPGFWIKGLAKVEVK